MTDQKIIEEMAKLEGFTSKIENVYDGSDKRPPDRKTVWRDSEGGKIPKPDYLNSHDDCQRVVDGMDNDTAEKYTRALIDSCGFACNRDFIQATARKKCEAILKAYGKGEDA